MKFIAAILVFVVFAALIGTGIVLMLAGKPLLLFVPRFSTERDQSVIGMTPRPSAGGATYL